MALEGISILEGSKQFFFLLSLVKIRRFDSTSFILVSNHLAAESIWGAFFERTPFCGFEGTPAGEPFFLNMGGGGGPLIHLFCQRTPNARNAFPENHQPKNNGAVDSTN